ncbi:MAG: response regulator transcription factor [Bryobacteraceae bacterium]
MANLRVFACDSQPIVLEGLRCLLADCPEIELTSAANSLEVGLAEIGACKPDLAIVDHGFGMAANMRFLAHANRLTPGFRVLIWGLAVDYGDRRAYKQAGVTAVAEKTWPLEAVRDCILQAAAGTTPQEEQQEFEREAPRSRKLTPRELEVAQLACRGLNNRQIADQLQITPGTVKVHLMHVFEKTGTRCRYELALHRWRFPGEERPGILHSPPGS